MYVHSEPVESNIFQSHSPGKSKIRYLEDKEKSMGAAANFDKPIAVSVAAERSRANEIFVDLVEVVEGVVGKAGNVSAYNIEGKLEIKSFLGGDPKILLGLSDNVVLDKHAKGKGGSQHSVFLDDVHFHRGTDLDLFNQKRHIRFAPESGSCTIVTYNINNAHEQKIKIPLKVNVQTDTEFNRGLQEPSPASNIFSFDSCTLVTTIVNQLPVNRSAKSVVVGLSVPSFIKHISLSVCQGDPKLVQKISESLTSCTGTKRPFRWNITELVGLQRISVKLGIVFEDAYAKSLECSGRIASYEQLCSQG